MLLRGEANHCAPKNEEWRTWWVSLRKTSPQPGSAEIVRLKKPITNVLSACLLSFPSPFPPPICLNAVGQWLLFSENTGECRAYKDGVSLLSSQQRKDAGLRGTRSHSRESTCVCVLVVSMWVHIYVCT